MKGNKKKSKTLIARTRKQSKKFVSFQNEILEGNDQEIRFKHHIRYSKMNEGHYMNSRATLDEAMIRNYVKLNKERLREFLNTSNVVQRRSKLVKSLNLTGDNVQSSMGERKLNFHKDTIEESKQEDASDSTLKSDSEHEEDLDGLGSPLLKGILRRKRKSKIPTEY